MEWQAVGSPECPGKRVLLKAIILGAGRDDLQVGAPRATASGCVSSGERNAGARNVAKGGNCA